MFLFRKKRGIATILGESWLYLVFLVISAILFVFFTMWVVQQSRTTLFEMDYLARDLATTISATFNAPNDLQFIYNEKTGWMKFGFSERYVVVSDGTPIPFFGTNIFFDAKGSYPFYPDRKTIVNKNYLEPAFKDNKEERGKLQFIVRPIITKNGDVLDIKDTVDDATKNNCPEFEKSNIDYDNLRISYHKKEGVLLKKTPELFEGDVLEIIKANIIAAKNQQEDKTKKISLLVGFGSYEKSSNYLKILASDPEDIERSIQLRSIACQIKTEIKKEMGIYDETTETIVEITPKIRDFFNQNGEAIYIEIGNINNEKSVNVLSEAANLAKIANAINNAFKK